LAGLTGIDYRGLLDAVADAVVAADPSDRIVFVNRAAEVMLDWPAQELVGQPLTTVIPSRLRGEHLKAFGRFVATGELRLGGRSLRVAALKRNGEEVEVDLTITAVLQDGRPWAVAVLRDRRGEIELERQRDLVRALRATADAAARLGSRFEIESLLGTVVHTLVADFEAALARIWLRPAEGVALVLRASAGLSRDIDASSRARIDPGTYPFKIARVARSREPFIKNGLEGDAEFDQEWIHREHIASAAVLPLQSSDELHGVLAYFSRRALSDEGIAALTAFSAIVSASLHDLQMFDRMSLSRTEAESQGAKLQTILDVLPVGVVLLEGLEGRVALANSAAAAIAGQPIVTGTYQDFVDRFALEHVDGRPVDQAERPLWRTLTADERVRELYRIRRPNGELVALQIATAPFPGPAGGAVSTFHDVTEQLRLEVELAERAGQLKALLEHLPVGVAYFDQQGNCRASNGPARRILGRSRREINGASADDLFAWSPALHEALNRCLAARTPHAETSAPWPDPAGQAPPRYLDWRFEALPGDSPKPVGALALIVDVTQRKATEDELQRAKDEAEQASRTKTQFLSAVSHDLRTPVNALSLQAELLALLVQSRDDPNGELVSLASDIQQAAANLIELVNDLLDLTRFDSGTLAFHLTEFGLEEWLEQTLRPLALAARTKGLKLSWRTDRLGRVVRADRIKLGRVLINLAGNAVKFTDSGEVEVTSEADSSGWLVLSVRDTGPGIPHEQLDRIFDEFAQLRNPERDRTKGTGLGLAICRRLVEAVGGRLTVESHPGRGSTFRAYYPPDHLPARAQPPDQAPRGNDPIAAAVAPRAAAPILLVEDDPYSRRSLCRLIEHAGYEVETVADGASALDAVQKHRPGLVLLDLMMPGMDGVEVLQKLRNQYDRVTLPVVILSGDILSDRTSQLRALEVNAILAKPVEIDNLLAAISCHLRDDGRSEKT
jgi:PAS domain S-box-containing protein